MKHFFMKKLPLFALLLCAGLTLSAQQRFKAAIIAGVTASQINGDLSAGYNKLGLQGGLRGITRLKGRSEASIEFLFAQRGAQTELRRDQNNPFTFSHTLNYLEIPLQWHYKDWLIEEDDERDNWYRTSFNIGFSYARFLSASSSGIAAGIRPVLDRDLLNKGDISFLLGANFMATRHIGFTFRYVRSFTKMYDPADYDPAPYSRPLIGHCLYIQSFYQF